MAEDREFSDLMDRLRLGDQDAAWEIIDLYGPHIERVVRRDLNYRLRSKCDVVDFVQSVWGSFFRQPSQFRRLKTPQELLEWLVTVARHKVIDETRRRLYSPKRDVSREEAIGGTPIPDIDKIPSNDPRPSQVAVAKEQWHRLFSEQSAENRKILEMRFAGKTYEEIAAKLKRHERTVRKIVEEILSKLEND